MVDTALFPIPRSVVFPGVSVPLHVFEPRYRQMVRYCIERELPMGVCHTEKVLHARQAQQTTEEALSSNQSTYKPRDVFSAGPVTLLQELEDGRMMISVEPDRRLALEEEIQTLPFSIWSCREVLDEAPGDEAHEVVAEYQDKILHRLIALTSGRPEVQEYLRGEYWQSLPGDAFSLAIAGRIDMDPDLAQHLLETTDTRYRLASLLELINSVG